jgi:hypothetical protein
MTTPRVDPKPLPGSLCCISTYFNHLGTATRQENFQVFHQRMMQHEANVLYGETALHERALELPNLVNDSLIAATPCGEHLLWQKETTLNLLLKQLPDDCDKVCWIDCDVLFENEDWQANICDALQRYRIVQGFDWVAMLPKGVEFVDGIDIRSFPNRFDDCSKIYGYVHGMLHDNIKSDNGLPGYVWAIRREVLEEMAASGPVFYDECVLGGADTLMARAATYNHYSTDVVDQHTRFQLASYFPWAQRWCDAIGYSFGYAPNHIYHLFHGKLSQRDCSKRWNLLQQLEFDPSRDLQRTEDGLWTVTQEGERLLVPARHFFVSRNEDQV